MSNYARNNAQLLNQMRALEYSRVDIHAVADAYQLATRMFSARFEPNGRVFISHIVGTASIVASLRVPVAVVVAGVLHNVYQNGDFGDGKSAITPARREAIKGAVGEEAEAHVAAFCAQRWNQTAIAELNANGVAALSPAQRIGVVLRLADQLEHLWEFDPLYVSNSRYTILLDTSSDALIELCEKLEYPDLAVGFSRVRGELKTHSVAPEFISFEKRSRIIAPRSYCLKSRLELRRRLVALRDRLRAAKTAWSTPDGNSSSR